MLCPNCGANNADGSTTCANCGAPLSVNPAAEAAAPATAPYTPAAPVYSASAPASPAAHPPPAAAALIPNYLVQSILITIFCCMPVGIVGIIFASQVNTKLAAGDLQGAAAASRIAKIWCIVGFCIGLVMAILGLLYLIFVVILVGASAAHS